MNKYMGFYELKRMNIPTVPWQRLTEDTLLDDNLLWTVRMAIEGSNDLNLPRAVGVTAEEAMQRGKMLLAEYGSKGMIIYYPYFIAEKSGVLVVNSRRTVIEAVKGDLWNLVTFGVKDMTALFLPDGEQIQYYGSVDFFSEEENEELLKYSSIIRGKFREELIVGKTIFAEWSYAYDTNTTKIPIGDRYLVFYELRGL